MGGKGRRGGAKGAGKGYEWRRVDRAATGTARGRGKWRGPVGQLYEAGSSTAAGAKVFDERRETAATVCPLLHAIPVLRPSLAYFRFRELLLLEATCFTMRDILTDQHSPRDWAHPAAFAARYWCLAVPPAALMDTHARDLKRAFAALRHLSGCPMAPAKLLNGEELSQVAKVCEQVSAANHGQKKRVQVVVGRLHFDGEDLSYASPSSMEGAPEETLFIFSNEVGFRWPGCIGYGEPCADLLFCIGCAQGQSVIELNSSTWPPVLFLSLCLDVHFVDPRLPRRWCSPTLRIPVCQMGGGCCSMPPIDIGDAAVRGVMTSQEGMLVVVTIRDMGELSQRSSFRPRGDAVTVRSLNALALASTFPLSAQTLMA